MNGWLKLWRQVADNEIFRRDRTAWHIFEVLWIHCRDGEWSGGRFQLADLCDENPNTIYKALKRLEKAEMLTLVSNNKYTVINICNWSRFQGVGNIASNNKVTTKEQQSNTLYRIKNRELKNNNTLALKCPEANQILKFYKETYGFKKNVPKQLENWRAAKWLFAQYGVDKTCQAILAAKQALEDSVSGAEKVPLIKNLMDLKEKYDQLRAYYGRKISRRGKKVDLSQI